MKTPSIPPDFDDALYEALRGILGDALAFAAVDAAWDVICEHGGLRSTPLTDRVNRLIGFDIGALK